MKKLGFALIAVLFALSLVTCGVFIPSETVENEVLDDGLGSLQPGEFFIGVSRAQQGRALTEALARAGADYFEVVFADVTNPLAPVIERAAFSEGSVVRMRAPVYGQVYNNAGNFKAYVFAGRNQSKILLGIGMIDEVTGPDNPAGDQAIKATTTSVLFRLEALITNINITASSTFSITATGVSILSVPVIGQNYNVPVFLVPKATANMPTSFKFNLTNHHGFTVNLFQAVLWAGAASSIITTRETVMDGYELQLAKVTAGPVAVAITGSNSATALIDVTFPITSPNKDGLGLMYIDIPVYLLDGPSGVSPTAVTWRLRGGLNNAIPDAGPLHNLGDGSLGGSVLIGVGSVFSGAGFEVGHTTDP